jgi:electron transport complex protein RnfG
MSAETNPPAGDGAPSVASLEPRHVAPSWRLVSTLAMAGVIAGLLIVFVYRTTLPAIEAHKARMLQLAIQDVLKAPERFDTLYLYDGALTLRLPEGADPRRFDKVYLGFDEPGRPVGYAITAGEPGFQDVIRLIFGYDPARGEVLGMKVLESKETPGLGDKIEKDLRFVTQFEGAEPPLEGVKSRGTPTTDPHEIDMITGATISSRTVIRIINNAVDRWRPALDAYAREGGP